MLFQPFGAKATTDGVQVNVLSRSKIRFISVIFMNKCPIIYLYFTMMYSYLAKYIYVCQDALEPVGIVELFVRRRWMRLLAGAAIMMKV